MFHCTPQFLLGVLALRFSLKACSSLVPPNGPSLLQFPLSLGQLWAQVARQGFHSLPVAFLTSILGSPVIEALGDSLSCAQAPLAEQYNLESAVLEMEPAFPGAALHTPPLTEPLLCVSNVLSLRGLDVLIWNSSEATGKHQSFTLLLQQIFSEYLVGDALMNDLDKPLSAPSAKSVARPPPAELLGCCFPQCF